MWDATPRTLRTKMKDYYSKGDNDLKANHAGRGSFICIYIFRVIKTLIQQHSTAGPKIQLQSISENDIFNWFEKAFSPKKDTKYQGFWSES